jgi:PAS domain S-box-containing protein
MRREIRLWIIATSAIALATLCVVSWLSYRSTRELIGANQRLSQAHNLIEDLTTLHVVLDDAESSCRDYALSGNADYLQPYDTALAQLDVRLQILRHDLASDANRSRQFKELEPLIQTRLGGMRELVEARQKGGFDDPIRVVQSDRGKNLSDEIRQRISVMQTEERNDLLDRERESRERARSTTVAVALTSAMGIALLLTAALVIYRITRESERAHSALHNAERIQRTILNSANYCMISTDSDGTILTVNAAAEKWLQYPSAELIGGNISKVHDEEELRVRSDQLTRAMGMPVRGDFHALVTKAKYGVAEEIDCTYVRKDGTRFPVSLSVTALRSQAEDSAGYLMIATDLSERRAIEKMKDEFVSVVSHELRTPLTSIKGALGLLTGGVTGKLPAAAEKMLQLALNNTDRLTRLVNDILDFERIESGQIKMETQISDTAQLMRESAESVHVIAQGEGVSVVLVPLAVPVRVDPSRIVQALVNLLGNAIKFSPPRGRIEFGADRSSGSVVFRIKDQGRGIPKDKLETIFERFQQVDASDSREKGGTGLGLAISRSIVQQHGGRVWAESELGRGSTFYVQLPLAEPDWQATT